MTGRKRAIVTLEGFFARQPETYGETREILALTACR